MLAPIPWSFRRRPSPTAHGAVKNAARTGQ